MSSAWLAALNDLAGGLFLINAFRLVVVSQVQESLTVFVAHSLLLSASALLLAAAFASPGLLAVSVLTLAAKAVVIPWLLRRTVAGEIYTRRELVQVVTIPASLLIALGLAVSSYFLTVPLVAPPMGSFARVNLPIGTAALLLGAYAIVVRREAIPQLIGILAMENGAFFAGVAISPDLPVIAEIAVAFDVPIIALVMGLLTRAIHERLGTTEVAALETLRERPRP